jgi:hypothetical protein
MIPILIAGLVVFGLPTLYFAIRSREFRKFLAGAFFVSAGMQLYFYLANDSMPLVGTSIVQAPELSRVRAILHFIFSWLLSIWALSASKKIQASRRDDNGSLSRRTCWGVASAVA